MKILGANYYLFKAISFFFILFSFSLVFVVVLIFLCVSFPLYKSIRILFFLLFLFFLLLFTVMANYLCNSTLPYRLCSFTVKKTMQKYESQLVTFKFRQNLFFFYHSNISFLKTTADGCLLPREGG